MQVSGSEGGRCRQPGRRQNFSGVASPGIVGIACQATRVCHQGRGVCPLVPLGAGAEAPATARVACFSQGRSFGDSAQ